MTGQTTTGRLGPRLSGARSYLLVAVVASSLAVWSGGCSGDRPNRSGPDGSPATEDWLDQHGPFSEVVDVDGHRVGVDEDARLIYTRDCAAAKELTRSGGAYGPGERDPETLDYTPGYGFVCN